jgi:hypothetical protein
MAGLTNIFGGDNDGSSNNASDGNASGNIVGDVGSTLGLDINSSNSSYDVDEDGNVSQQSSDNSVGLDTSTDGLLGAVGDLMGSNDSESTSN